MRTFPAMVPHPYFPKSTIPRFIMNLKTRVGNFRVGISRQYYAAPIPPLLSFSNHVRYYAANPATPSESNPVATPDAIPPTGESRTQLTGKPTGPPAPPDNRTTDNPPTPYPDNEAAAPNASTLSHPSRGGHLSSKAPRDHSLPIGRKLQEVEAMWYQRYNELDDKWYLRNKKLVDEHAIEIQKKSGENASLTSMLLQERTEKLKLEGNFNLRGALERTVYQARLLGKIPYIPKERMQPAIDRLAQTPEFQKVFREEVARRGLRPQDVIPCLAVVYHECSKHAHGNDGIITIRAKDYIDNERAALATILKVQEGWVDGLQWREVEKGEEDPE